MDASPGEQWLLESEAGLLLGGFKKPPDPLKGSINLEAHFASSPELVDSMALIRPGELEKILPESLEKLTGLVE